MLADNILETALDQSRPNHIEIDDTVRARLDEMVQAVSLPSARAQKSRPSKWRRPVFLFPAIGVLAIATTAGAVAYSFNSADAVIPINYTTNSGQQITCGYGITGGRQVGEGSTAPLLHFVESHDWAGTGQKAYRYAITHPYVPTAAERGQFTQVQIDSFSFSQALAAVIGEQIPASVEPVGYLGGGETDCRGILR